MMIVGLPKHDKKKRLKSPCWGAGNRKEKKKENYHVGLMDMEKNENKTITMLGYLKSKRENYHVGLPERKEG